MSFPKARILRFNEVASCAPPPGKYDPKYDVKVKGAALNKSKRFVEGKLEAAPSVTSQDSASSCSHGYNPIGTFRTPQLPRKKLISTPRSAVERSRTPKELSTECKTRKRLNYENEQNLIEQINELTRVHSSQLLDKDQELLALQHELEELRSALSKAENNHINDYNTMKQKYEKEIKAMKDEIEEVIKSAETQKAESERVNSDLGNQVSSLEENLKNCNSVISDLMYQLAEANINIVEARNEYAALEKELKSSKELFNTMITHKNAELEKFAQNYSAELDKIGAAAEDNIYALASKMEQKLKSLERDLDVVRMDLSRDFESKIDSIADEVRDKVDLFESRSSALQLKIKTMAEDFNMKLTDLVGSIDKLGKIDEDKLKENLDLTEQLAVCRANCLEKKIVVVDLENIIEELKDRVSHLTNQCRKFEIVQNEANKTIHVLSQRLFESESEVERLNDTTEELELRKDALEEKVKSVVNENSVLKIKITELQQSLIRDVKEVETLLIAKVEAYRLNAIDETNRYKFELGEKQKAVEMLMEQVDFYGKKAAESVDIINACQNRIDRYKEEIKELMNKSDTALAHISKLEDEIDVKNNMVQKLNSECEHVKKELGEARNRFASASKDNSALNETIKEMTKTIAEKDSKLEAVTRENEEFKRLNENLSSKTAELMNDLMMKEAQCENLSQDVEVKNLTMVQVSDEYEKMKKLYEDECRRADEQEADNLKYVGELVSDLMLEKQRCSELVAKVNELSDQVVKMEDNNVALTDDILLLNNEKSTLQFRILELENSIKQSDEQKADLIKEKEDLIEIVQRQWDERELMSNQIESQQEEITELKLMKDERFEEEKAIYQAELQNEIFALQQNLEDTQKHAIDLRTRNDELIFKLNSAESELTVSEAEKDRQEHNLKELIEKLASLETKYASMEKRKNEYKMYSCELEAEKGNMKRQLDEMLEEKERMLEDKKEVSMELTSQTARLADLECRCRELQETNNSLESMVGPFKELLIQYEKERSDLLLKSNETEKELKAMTLAHAKALGHTNHLQKIHHVVSLTENIASLKKENQKLLAENAKLRANLLSAQEGTVKRIIKGKKDDKENNSQITSSSTKSKNKSAENRPSRLASPLQTRNSPVP